MNGKTSKEGMSLIVKTVTHWLKGFLLLYGIYVVLYGHLTPGGGFPGGVILASAFILLTLSVGALIFLGVALLGLFIGGVFFKNFIQTAAEAFFDLFSAGIIPICNIGIGLKVGTSLFMVFTILAAVRVVTSKGKRKVIQRGGKQP